MLGHALSSVLLCALVETEGLNQCARVDDGAAGVPHRREDLGEVEEGVDAVVDGLEHAVAERHIVEPHLEEGVGLV